MLGEKHSREWGRESPLGASILNRAVEGGLREKVTSESRLERGEKGNDVAAGGKRNPNRRVPKCKGTGLCLSCEGTTRGW